MGLKCFTVLLLCFFSHLVSSQGGWKDSRTMVDVDVSAWGCSANRKDKSMTLFGTWMLDKAKFLRPEWRDKTADWRIKFRRGGQEEGSYRTAGYSAQGNGLSSKKSESVRSSNKTKGSGGSIVNARTSSKSNQAEVLFEKAKKRYGNYRAEPKSRNTRYLYWQDHASTLRKSKFGYPKRAASLARLTMARRDSEPEPATPSYSKTKIPFYRARMVKVERDEREPESQRGRRATRGFEEEMSTGADWQYEDDETVMAIIRNIRSVATTNDTVGAAKAKRESSNPSKVPVARCSRDCQCDMVCSFFGFYIYGKFKRVDDSICTRDEICKCSF